jgi:ABC-type uncharacterized transport system substrate-binding protein
LERVFAGKFSPPFFSTSEFRVKRSGPTHRRIEYRWGAGNADNERKYAAELLALTPDVIVASGSLAVAAFQRLTRTVPIVFTLISDPIGGRWLAQSRRNRAH